MLSALLPLPESEVDPVVEEVEVLDTLDVAAWNPLWVPEEDESVDQV